MLGIELLDPPEPVVTGGGTINGWRREVEIALVDWLHGDQPVAFHATVYFVEGRSDLALLGLVGFFDKFTLKIDDANQQLWWTRT